MKNRGREQKTRSPALYVQLVVVFIHLKGFICAEEELREFLQCHISGVSTADADRLMQRLDFDGDGAVTASE